MGDHHCAHLPNLPSAALSYMPFSFFILPPCLAVFLVSALSFLQQQNTQQNTGDTQWDLIAVGQQVRKTTLGCDAPMWLLCSCCAQTRLWLQVTCTWTLT